MSHLNETMICQHIFLCGMKKGQKCLYPNCRIHDEYNCNLAKYLNLPRYFIDSAKQLHSDTYFVLVKTFQNMSSCDNLGGLVENVKTIIDLSEKMRVISLRELLIVFMYICLDIPNVIKHLLSPHDKFKKVVYNKITNFSSFDNKNGSLEFKKYLSENFVANRRFLSIKKNTEYKKRTFRIYMKTLVLCNSWFSDVMEKRYAPGGKGALEAEKRFLSSLIYQSKGGEVVTKTNVRRSERIKKRRMML